MASSSKSCECCGRLASVICCGRRHCTACFYFSAHVRHTSAHGAQSKAAVLSAARLRNEVQSEVQPQWERVWEHLAKDVARATEQLARGAAEKAASDPLGAALADEKEEVEENKRRKAKSALRERGSTLLHHGISSSSSFSSSKRPRSSNERTSELVHTRLPASLNTTTATAAASFSGPDPFKRTATRPRDIWHHPGMPRATAPQPTNDEADQYADHMRGPACPNCESRKTLRSFTEEDRGRKSEIWGSANETDTVSYACHECGFKWLDEKN